MACSFVQIAVVLLLGGLAGAAPSQPLSHSLFPRAAAPAGWTYSGCITLVSTHYHSLEKPITLNPNRDNVNNQRTLAWQLILSNNNSAENCISACQAFGYDAAGTEFGDECCKLLSPVDLCIAVSMASALISPFY